MATLLTAEDFFVWANRPENRDRRFELEQGKVVELALSGQRQSAVCGNVAGILGNYTRLAHKGYVCTNNMALILERNPDTVRGPDVVLYTEKKKSPELSLGFPENLPTLVVEVLAPDDRPNRMMKRIKEFLNRGVSLVWLLDPEARDLTVHRLQQPNQFFGEQDELTGLEELPGFRCPVREFFSLPG